MRIPNDALRRLNLFFFARLSCSRSQENLSTAPQKFFLTAPDTRDWHRASA